MLNFCTLFNSHYLVKGVAMYQSLIANSPESHLYILAMDDFSLRYLRESNFRNLTVISLQDFENESLQEVKKDRSFAEYCWTCSSSLLSFCLNNYALKSCTYVDADIIFYEDPQILLSEVKQSEYDVLITEHGFDKDHKHLEAYGKFCIQFLYFTNSVDSLKILDKWRKQCIEWCYSWAEKERFGDQKYLDEWPNEYPSVKVLEHVGALAPWNISRFHVIPKANQQNYFDVFEKSTGISAPLVFYHFHDLKIYSNNTLCLVNGYDVTEVKGKLYYPYLTELVNIEKSIIDKYPSFEPEKIRPIFTSDNFFRSMSARFNIILRKQKLRLMGRLNSKKY